MKKILGSLTAAALFIPAVVFAQTQPPPVINNLKDVAATANFYINLALYMLMAVAVLLFVFYVIKYFMIAGADRKEAGQYVMYSLIGFFVVLSVWGLVNILSGTFKFRSNAAPQPGEIDNLFPRSNS